MFGFRKRRRNRLRAQPLAESAWAMIDRNVPYIRQLSPTDRKELAGIVQVLLAEKYFEGCGGLEMTDEIRLTIAAQAAVLLLHRDTDYYPTLRSILVYPAAYIAASRLVQPDGTVIEGPQTRLGESWFRGSIVLSWSDVMNGARDPHDGRNVVFHEFAHQLDGETGAMDGAPALGAAARYQAWARVLGAEYTQLLAAVHTGHPSLIDRYGATNPAEFFAVVTE
ncbi:MAG: zinc-dependent peptidase, partial [Phycisphaerales bacterium]|nr:zinc-dependent peptidase [Phycisphaerales bacterium]